MPFETDALILDNIRNLYYLRFLLSNEGFYHSMKELCVVSTSRYYRSLVANNKISNWDYTPMQEFMVDNFIKDEYKYDVFLIQTNINNPLWNLFTITEKAYKDGNYSYDVSYDKDICFYAEMQNNDVIKHITLSSLEQQILKCCDREIQSFEGIKNIIVNASLEDITKTINKLQEEGIIYASNQYDEVVSIITLTK